uniref:Putative secreted protein n=1 Tax=Anopheles darlingi TaxID=43151 RepID=A0A2M4D5M7_ANODA
MLHFISSLVTGMFSSASVSASVVSTSPTTCANSLYSGSSTNSTKLRCAELCGGFLVNLRDLLWKYMSPQSRLANSLMFTPSYVSAYRRAKDFNVKQMPYSELAKQTFPCTGETGLTVESPCRASRPLISSTMWRSLKYASWGGSFSSRMSRSILLIHTVSANFSCMACFSNRSVLSETPSATSTNSTTPSQSRIDAVTSSEKFTCPGVSNTLMRKLLPFTSGSTSVIGDALMLTPRSCSVKSVSVYRRLRSSMLRSCGWVWRTRQSTKVVLPWCR